jgi:hypothetical protein
MPLFDFYIMVDWSGGARRRAGRPDTIWVAHGPISADTPLTDSPFSRTEAVRLIHSLLVSEIELNRTHPVKAAVRRGFCLGCFAAAFFELFSRAAWAWLVAADLGGRVVVLGRPAMQQGHRDLC